MNYVLLHLCFFARRDDFPPGRPLRTREEPDQGVRRGRGPGADRASAPHLVGDMLLSERGRPPVI